MIEADALAAAPPISAVAAWVRDRVWIGRWWLGGRILVWATAAVVHAVGPAGRIGPIEHSRVLGVLASWDARWYRVVAAHGYLLVPGRQSDPAFFPLYPSLLRVAHALGVGYVTSGVAVANCAFLVALAAFDCLTRELFGAAFAHRATVYLAIFPFGYVFSMAYPESVVLAAIVLGALCALRGRWLLAAAFAGVAALARPEGVFVALPIAAVAWSARDRLSPVRRGLAAGATLAPVAACAAYPLYLGRVLHDPLAWSRAERAWGRHFTPLGLARAIEHVAGAFDGNAWVVRDIVATLLYVALLTAAARARVPLAWLVAGAAVIVLPLFSGAFTSVGRFGLLAVPVFWGLALIGATHRRDVAIRAVSLVLLVAGTATIPLAFP